MDPIVQKLKALGSFKDRSNYLLLTTSGALGWTATATFSSGDMKPVAVICFALSIVFAILTPALIPHVAEDIKGG